MLPLDSNPRHCPGTAVGTFTLWPRATSLSCDLHGLQTMPPEHVIAHAFAPLRRFYASSLCALVLIYYGLDSSIELSWVQQDLGHQHIYQGW